MRLLLDTNIFLEVILDQESAEEARTLLSKVEEHEFFLSDYSLHSIGLLLFRRGQHEIFRQFLIDMILEAGVTIIALSAQEMEGVIQVAQRFGLTLTMLINMRLRSVMDLRLSASTATLIGRQEDARRRKI